MVDIYISSTGSCDFPSTFNAGLTLPGGSQLNWGAPSTLGDSNLRIHSMLLLVVIDHHLFALEKSIYGPWAHHIILFFFFSK